MNDAGESVPIPGGGYLVLTRPWPSMLRGIWGDPERYRDTYWGRFGDRYFAGDGAKRDDDGYYWLLGRVDDVMLVSGHNISTAEVEHALVGHPAVAEAAVVGTKDDTTGQAISAFVILRSGNDPSDALVAELRDHVGAHDRPDRQAEEDPVHRGSPEDALRQDHAPAPARRRRGPGARRHHHPRRPVGRRRHQVALPRDVDRRRRVTTSGYAPEHWTWHDGPVEPGPGAIVDLDGVLSDAASRQHYLERPRRDWDAFFEACGDDDVIEEIKVLLDLLDPELRILLLTARPERVHHLTEAWLRRYQIRWDLLVMRPWGDYDYARDFKQASVWDLRRYGFDLGSRSRTTGATSRCSAPRASRASTSTPATTTEPAQTKRRCRADARDAVAESTIVKLRVERPGTTAAVAFQRDTGSPADGEVKQ